MNQKIKNYLRELKYKKGKVACCLTIINMIGFWVGVWCAENYMKKSAVVGIMIVSMIVAFIAFIISVLGLQDDDNAMIAIRGIIISIIEFVIIIIYLSFVESFYIVG